MKKLLDEKKALDIEIIDIGEDSIISDYFVICTGTSNTHIKAIADGLLIDGKQEGLIKNHVEGYNQAKWLLVDYGDIVVHIFAKEEREYYDIESLWQKTASILEQPKEQ
ncbi:MAG: ribosome silencing factor [Armatimonadota bacterium]